MKILYLTKYTRMAGSSRMRSYQYFPYLEKEGMKITVKPFFDEAYLKDFYTGKKNIKTVLKSYLRRFFVLFTIFNYDKIVVEKEIFPFLPAFAEWILKILGIKYVVDYDDAIFHNYDKSSNSIIKKKLGSKIAKVMRYSGTVVAGNRYLADYAQKAGAKNIEIIPTVIDLNRYSSKNNGLELPPFRVGEKNPFSPFRVGGTNALPPFRVGEKHTFPPFSAGGTNALPPFRVGGTNAFPPFRAGETHAFSPFRVGETDAFSPFRAGEKNALQNYTKFIVGWIGTKTTFEKHLLPCKDWIKELQKQDPDINFHIVGITKDVDLGNNVKYIQWTEETEVSEILKMDVGIMPLQDSDWEKGKCAYKLIQYAACGIPGVASDVGMNKEVCIDNETGFIAKTKEDWIEKIRFLKNNDSARRQLGKSARKLVEEKYCIQVTAKRWIKILKECS